MGGRLVALVILRSGATKNLSCAFRDGKTKRDSSGARRSQNDGAHLTNDGGYFANDTGYFTNEMATLLAAWPMCIS
jgi:hypothetical protein